MSIVKKILITGAARRLGYKMADYLLKEGYEVIVHYNQSQKEAEQMQRDLGVRIIACDLQDPGNLEGFIKEVGSIDVLINNAAIFINDNPDSFKPEGLYQHINVNAVAPILLMQGLSGLKRVINILDSYAEKDEASFISYRLSKRLLKNFSDIGAKYWAPRLQINNIMLGFLMHGEPQALENYLKAVEGTPMQKEVDIKDLYAALSLLLNSGTITGANIKVDSGLSL